MSILDAIRPIAYPRERYVEVTTEKRQVVVRHTGLRTGPNDRLGWLLENEPKLPAAMLIDQEGQPWQCFASRFWARHLGLKAKFFSEHGFSDAGTRGDLLNQGSIAVELHAAGGLLFYRGQWYMGKKDPTCGEVEPNLQRPVNRNQVVAYPGGYNGFDAYERYTEKQLETLGQLLRLWCTDWRIPDAPQAEAWTGGREPLAGTPGIWTMAAFRPETALVHPQEELVTLLQTPEQW